MGRLFGHKRYDDILEEIETQGGWVEYEDEAADADEVIEEYAEEDSEELIEDEDDFDEEFEDVDDLDEEEGSGVEPEVSAFEESDEEEPEDALYNMVVGLLEEET